MLQVQTAHVVAFPGTVSDITGKLQYNSNVLKTNNVLQGYEMREGMKDSIHVVTFLFMGKEEASLAHVSVSIKTKDKDLLLV